MITIIGAVIGFLSSFAPVLVDYLKLRVQKNQELELMKIRVVAARDAATAEIDVTRELQSLEQLRMAYAQDAESTGIKWVEAIRALIRPSITFAFFGMFLLVKLVGMYRLIDLGVPLVDTVGVIWDEDTAAMFSCIIAFYFGNRTIQRMR